MPVPGLGRGPGTPCRPGTAQLKREARSYFPNLTAHGTRRTPDPTAAPSLPLVSFSPLALARSPFGSPLGSLAALAASPRRPRQPPPRPVVPVDHRWPSCFLDALSRHVVGNSILYPHSLARPPPPPLLWTPVYWIYGSASPLSSPSPMVCGSTSGSRSDLVR
jgi:hypothetical protein